MSFAVGVGSMPGTSPHEALAIIAGELGDQLHIPELPARGPGAEMIGRTFALLNLVDRSFAIDTTPSGWRVASGEPVVMRRGKAWLGEDLDALAQIAAVGSPRVKLQLCGPFSLAAMVEPVSGDRLLTDRGAIRDLAAGIVAGFEFQLAQLRALLPSSELVLQVDEPMLQLVLEGRIATRTKRGSLPGIALAEVQEVLRQIAAAGKRAATEVWIHSCASSAPTTALLAAGFDAWLLPLASVDSRQYEQLAAHWEAGGIWVVGLPDSQQSVADSVRAIQQVTRQIGLDPHDLTTHIAVSRSCGLAFSPQPAAALKFASRVAAALTEAEDSA